MRHPLLPDSSIVNGLPVAAIRIETSRDLREMSRSSRWYYSANGAKWRRANVERRRAYQRAYYHSNPARRAYLVMKRREYRAKGKQ